MKHVASSALVALLALGCDSTPESPSRAPAAPQPLHLPPSALATAVRALGLVEQARPADALVQVRALESDVLALPSEHVRVFLHLTVYAPDAARASAAFAELGERLAGERLDTAPLAPERVVSTFAMFDWSPEGREDLVSYSDVVRLEVPAAREAPSARAASAREGERVALRSLESWVRTVAASERFGRIDLSVSPRTAPPGVEELRFRLHDEDPTDRHSRGEIGGFLAELDSESPAARVTHVKLERSQHEADPRAVRAWTYEAELTVRVPAGTAGGGAASTTR